MSSPLIPDNQERGDFAAMRARLGFALAAKPRMRLDLIRPHLRPAPPPVVMVSEIAAVELPPEPAPMYGAPFNFLKQPGWRAIVKLVGLKHQVTTDAILGSSRSHSIVVARQEAMHLVFRHCEFSLPEIGKRFNKDHTTVLHAIRVIEGRAKKRGRKC